jgi:arsenate reductase
MVKIYTYSKCSTCKLATTWLAHEGIKFEEIQIRQTPPTIEEFELMLSVTKSLKKLFNTSGLDYRAMDLASRFDTLSKDEAFKLLLSNGNLVKRPFLVSKKAMLVGFDPKVWREKLIV